MIKRKHKASNPIIFRPGVSIGSTSAENDDEFIFDCFIHHHAVESFADVNSPSMIISGRTGAGKTALIRHLQNAKNNVAYIEPSEMAMNYVANSDIFRFLDAIGADLNLHFQSLWRHVLCIEFIRLRFDIRDETASRSLFSNIWHRFSRDPRQKTALDYLKDWEGKFWITMDQNIKEITEKIENQIQAEMGSEIAKFRTRGQYQKQLGSEKKIELVARAKKIINEDQLIELNKIISMLHEYSDQTPLNYYIMIDQLDEHWVSTDLRFRLIRGLLESLRKFRKIQSLKILIALRSDVFERVIQETEDLSFQREKFDEYSVPLTWSEAELKDLVQKRMHKIFSHQYTGKTVTFEHIFQHKVGKQDPFKYLLERTLYRPRDLITFINSCLTCAVNKTEITGNTIKQAEKEYSRIRRTALEQEWKSAYPTLKHLLDFLAENKEKSFLFKDILTKTLAEDLAYKIATTEKIDYDPVHNLAVESIEKNSDHSSFLKEVLSILYTVGAISLKLSTTERHSYSHLDQPIIDPIIIHNDVRVRVHPMLHSTLNLHDRH